METSGDECVPLKEVADLFEADQGISVIHQRQTHTLQADNQEAVARQQQKHSNEQQATRHVTQEKRGEREGEEREKGRKGERGKKDKGREAEEERDEEVKKDVTGWTVVTRNNRKKRRTIQIFVKVNESRTFPLDVSPDDKVDDVMRQIQSEEDVYVTLRGRVLKRSEKLKSCEVTDGCTIQVTSRMRGGGRHKDKRSKAETKGGMDESGQKDQQVGLLVDKCQEMTQTQKDVVIQPLEAIETYQRMITMILEAEDEEREMQCFGKQLQEKSGVEARRRRRDAEQEQQRQEEQRQRRQEEQGQNTGQEQGKKDKQVTNLASSQKGGRTGPRQRQGRRDPELSRRGTGGEMVKEETGARENQKRRKQHPARCLPLPQQPLQQVQQQQQQRQRQQQCGYSSSSVCRETRQLCFFNG